MRTLYATACMSFVAAIEDKLELIDVILDKFKIGMHFSYLNKFSYTNTGNFIDPRAVGITEVLLYMYIRESKRTTPAENDL